MKIKKDYILETISEILDIEKDILKDETKPYDIIEWDSLANMNIFVSLNDHPEIDIDFPKYIACKKSKARLE